ncbi:adhesion G protein-coupled receptor A1 [Homo sapiens]|uniref:Isoform 1 of Adhesion G protein-coupled receptor A1 n=2 Tax=Homo sapiens TaxID=9606 RepID=Q86SQ6-1|eukprot:XP_005252752.1 adhesion G protein-coupled receptor A1 isoform X1 [Homo sapiens]
MRGHGNHSRLKSRCASLGNVHHHQAQMAHGAHCRGGRTPQSPDSRGPTAGGHTRGRWTYRPIEALINVSFPGAKGGRTAEGEPSWAWVFRSGYLQRQALPGLPVSTRVAACWWQHHPGRDSGFLGPGFIDLLREEPSGRADGKAAAQKTGRLYLFPTFLGNKLPEAADSFGEIASGNSVIFTSVLQSSHPPGTPPPSARKPSPGAAMLVCEETLELGAQGCWGSTSPRGQAVSLVGGPTAGGSRLGGAGCTMGLLMALQARRPRDGTWADPRRCSRAVEGSGLTRAALVSPGPSGVEEDTRREGCVLVGSWRSSTHRSRVLIINTPSGRTPWSQGSLGSTGRYNQTRAPGSQQQGLCSDAALHEDFVPEPTPAFFQYPPQAFSKTKVRDLGRGGLYAFSKEEKVSEAQRVEAYETHGLGLSTGRQNPVPSPCKPGCVCQGLALDAEAWPRHPGRRPCAAKEACLGPPGCSGELSLPEEEGIAPGAATAAPAWVPHGRVSRFLTVKLFTYVTMYQCKQERILRLCISGESGRYVRRSRFRNFAALMVSTGVPGVLQLGARPLRGGGHPYGDSQAGKVVEWRAGDRASGLSAGERRFLSQSELQTWPRTPHCVGKKVPQPVGAADLAPDTSLCRKEGSSASRSCRPGPGHLTRREEDSFRQLAFPRFEEVTFPPLTAAERAPSVHGGHSLASQGLVLAGRTRSVASGGKQELSGPLAACIPTQDLKTVLSLPRYPGEFLHPVVYACTAVMLLCLLASFVTYIVHQSAIRISRKGRHTLLNFCFHAALTFTVFAGGINRTKYPILCQAVGIVLHYSTLSTMLWIGVTARNIYKQVTKKAPLCLDTDQPPYPRQPLLRFYLVSGGVPFIICGVTAATNIRNYGTEDEDTACWMAWEPSLGAFYGPAAIITLVTCVYFLGTYVQLRRHPGRRYELRTQPEEQRRLATPEGGRGIRPGTPPAHDAPGASVLQNEHSFQAQLRAAAFTLFLFTATWAFGALAVSQGHFLDMVFSCLYGAFCVTLGLFVLIHHCAKREDVWQCWWACCPPRKDAHPALDANGAALGRAACLHSPGLGQPRGFAHPPGPCKMTNLQAAQGHASCLSPATPCCAKMHCEPLTADEAHVHLQEEGAFGHDPHLHGCLQGRTKPPYFSRHPAEEPEYAYHIPSSLDGSPRSSRTDSPPSSLDGPAGTHTLACCTQGDPFPMVTQPEGSDGSPALYSCPTQPGREAALGPGHLEMLRRTQSLPFGGPSQNGLPKGKLLEGLPFGTDGTGNIRTGPWKNETTV